MTSPYLKMRASWAATDNRSKSVHQLLGVSVNPMLSPQPRLPWRLTEKTGWNNETLIDCHDDEISGERIGMVLVKRVFSMRRPASVSERDCRIHDQSNTPTAYFEGKGSMDEETGSPLKPVKQQQQQQHKGGKIIKACKSFFNLK